MCNFKPGDEVVYTPTYSDGSPCFINYENGIVTSMNDIYVFVLFDEVDSTSSRGPCKSQPILPKDLIKQ